MINTKNIIFEAVNFHTSTELLLMENEGEFELHITQDDGISEDGKEFLNKSVSIKIDIADFARLVEVLKPYLDRDGYYDKNETERR